MVNYLTILFSIVENELTIFNIEPMDGFVNLGSGGSFYLYSEDEIQRVYRVRLGAQNQEQW